MEVCTYFLREVKVQWKDNSNLKKINLFPQIMKSLEMESFQIEASSSLSLFLFCFACQSVCSISVCSGPEIQLHYVLHSSIMCLIGRMI